MGWLQFTKNDILANVFLWTALIRAIKRGEQHIVRPIHILMNKKIIARRKISGEKNIAISKKKRQEKFLACHDLAAGETVRSVIKHLFGSEPLQVPEIPFEGKDEGITIGVIREFWQKKAHGPQGLLRCLDRLFPQGGTGSKPQQYGQDEKARQKTLHSDHWVPQSSHVTPSGRSVAAPASSGGDETPEPETARKQGNQVFLFYHRTVFFLPHFSRFLQTEAELLLQMILEFCFP